MAESAGRESPAETLDVSARGVRIETETPPPVGAVLNVRLRMPEMIMGWRVPEWRITGHVIHVEQGSDAGTFAVGVQFHYYEPMATERRKSIAEFRGNHSGQLLASLAGCR